MHAEDERTRMDERTAFSVDMFRPEDAGGIVRLFRTVYGDGYPVKLFYDARAIADANAEGRYHSIVARSQIGEVIGATHVFRSAYCPSLYEWGAGLVLPAYRKGGVNQRLAEFLFNTFVPGHPSIEELFGESVCNHTHLQKSTSLFGFVPSAIEVALMPAEAYVRENSAPGRVATLAGFRCYRPKPHAIFLPAAYETVVRDTYRRLNASRDIAVSTTRLPSERATSAETSVFETARVARIAVVRAGGDFAARLSEIEAHARNRKAAVFQVFLNLTEPWVGEAADILRDRGYFFGGALPRWFDGDGLLLQKLECPPDFDQIVLWTDEAKNLLRFIRKDRERVTGVAEGRSPGLSVPP